VTEWQFAESFGTTYWTLIGPVFFKSPSRQMHNPFRTVNAAQSFSDNPFSGERRDAEINSDAEAEANFATSSLLFIFRSSLYLAPLCRRGPS
jgi:hypothetical protein